MTIYLIRNKELKLKIIIVHGEISFFEFLKGQFWDHCYLLSYKKINKNVKNIVNPLQPDSTNGQTQSKYSLAIAGELFECV